MPSLRVEIPEGSSVTQNTSSNFMVITEDKIENVLLKHEKHLKDQLAWATPFTLILSIGLSLLTTDFKNFIFTADTWRFVFVAALIIASIWFIVEFIRLIHFHNERKGLSSVNFLIEKMKEVKKDDVINS